MNNNLIVNQFSENKQLTTIMWKGQPIWIAKQLAELAGQADSSNSISVFLKNNDFLENIIDYEILKGIELKEFKKVIGESPITSMKYTPQLVIFRESALWAYLQSLRTEIGKALKRWINREVLPSIRHTGAYITDNADSKMLRIKANEMESALNEIRSLNKVKSYEFDGKHCWILKSIVLFSGRDRYHYLFETFKTRNPKIKEHIDYEILKYQNLKKFKRTQGITDFEIGKSSSKVVILFESGVKAFIDYLNNTSKDKECGDYKQGTLFDYIEKQQPKTFGQLNVIENISAMKVALDSVKMFNTLIDEAGLSSSLKLSIAKELFNKAGINIPDNIEVVENNPSNEGGTF